MRLTTAFALSGLLLQLHAPVGVAAQEGDSEGEAVGDGDGADGYGAAVVVPRHGVSLAELPRSTWALDESELREAQPRTTAEAFSELLVHPQITNRGAGSPILRGLVGPQNLVLLDGIRLNNSTWRTGPNQYLSLVDPSHLARADLVLGPGSVLHGSDALGGVMALSTRPMPLRSGFFNDDMLTFRSADNAFDLEADVAYRTGPFAARFGGALRLRDELRTGGGAGVALSEYQQGAFRAHMWAETSRRSVFGLGYYAGRMRNAGRVDALGRGDYRRYDNDDDLLYADYRLHSGPNRLRAALFVHRTAEIVDRTQCARTSIGSVADRLACIEADRSTLTRLRRYDDGVWTPGVLFTYSRGLFAGRLKLTTGLDASSDFVSSARFTSRASDAFSSYQRDERGNFSDGSAYRRAGLFVATELDLLSLDGDSRIVLGVGARVAIVDASAPEVPGIGDVSYGFIGAVGNASLRYMWRDDVTVYTSWAQGFRAPNLQETTELGASGSTFEIPNSDLQPERANTFESGIKVDLHSVRAQLAQFTTFISDAIVRENIPEAEWRRRGYDPVAVNGAPVVSRVNAQGAQYIGIEAALAVDILPLVTLFGRVHATRGDVLLAGGQSGPARRVPPLSGTAGLRLRLPRYRLKFAIFGRWAAAQTRLADGDREDLRICEDRDVPGVVSAACEGTPGWLTLNLRAAYQPVDQLTLYLNVENAGDVLYRVHGSGFNAPGLSATISARVVY